jgi:8-hydroxy-5-deazaflavin:NADPH oxidoreductase
MRLGFLGAGGLATALARQLGGRGHEAMLSYSRDAGRLADAAAAVGARSGTPAEAAEFGDVIVLAAPWASVPDALAQAGDLGGKVLWDCTNPLTADMRGLVLGTTTSGGEEVARIAFRARMVKGIPPLPNSWPPVIRRWQDGRSASSWPATMRRPSRLSQRSWPSSRRKSPMRARSTPRD